MVLARSAGLTGSHCLLSRSQLAAALEPCWGSGTHHATPSTRPSRATDAFTSSRAGRAHDEVAQSRSVCVGGWIVKGGSAVPWWPLLLRRELAAQYIGMSPSTFDAERK